MLPSPVRLSCSVPHPCVHLISCSGGRFATQHIPVDILSAELAANDNLAYPFLSIAIYLTVKGSTRVVIGKWFLVGLLCELLHVGGLLQLPDLIVPRRSSYPGHHSLLDSAFGLLFYRVTLL